MLSEAIKLCFINDYVSLFTTSKTQRPRTRLRNVLIRHAVKQDLVLEFCRSQNKVISILTETRINQDHMHQIRNNWSRPIFYSPGDAFI